MSSCVLSIDCHKFCVVNSDLKAEVFSFVGVFVNLCVDVISVNFDMFLLMQVIYLIWNEM